MTFETRKIAKTVTLATFWLASAVFAQDQDVDDLMPAVDTSAMPVQRQAPAEGRRSPRNSQVMDTLELGRTEITGNQELPKVLYIVPWKKSDPGDLMGRPVNTLIDEVLAPLDREEFLRQIRYYEDLQGDDDNE